MERKETVQISATIDAALSLTIREEAFKDNRSFSEMVGMLLAQAIKERERQRAKRKKNQENSN
jgi:hypothetical protein